MGVNLSLILTQEYKLRVLENGVTKIFEPKGDDVTGDGGN
jgi:hypothetical protein